MNNTAGDLKASEVLWDMALGLANPALGLVASGVSLGAVHLVSTLVVLCAAVIALQLVDSQNRRFWGERSRL